ncbi:adenosine deaminase [Blastomyces dermatitidis ATCC 18188]|uniref:adenosine deaminase n=1 Tax=Ajellomyces dermatitidis (strain ATCC 18188 / CBS 674.68) TaxID=653446 RepID=F2TFV6_AJEDA|nr:adenosine deaminase [Blastomyces dermatitidis ATCC 18188]
MVHLQWIQETFSYNKKTQRNKHSSTHSPTSTTPASAADYFEALNTLQQQERELAFDAAAIAKASKSEKDAASVLEAIRGQERRRYLASGASDYFLANTGLINHGSDLMQVAQRLPKGAHLHCHFNTILHPSFLVSQARNIKCMFIRSTLSLNAQLGNLNNTAITFSVLRDSTEGADIFDTNYKPLAWMRYSKFLEDFPGGAERAEEWLVNKLLISPEDAHGMDQTLDGVWDLFNRSTQMMKGLFNYESAFRNYIEKAIDSFVEDNVMYAEVRPNFFDKYIPSDDGERQLDHRVWMQIIRDEVKAKIKQLDADGKGAGRFKGLKVIYCAPRSIKNEDMAWCLKDCISLKQEFPELICGFDMVGCEGRGNPIRHYISELLQFKAACTALDLDIPFIFHAGETLESQGPTDNNLYDAILLGSKRIGHGFSMPQHPLLMQLCRDRGIALEICPISNEVLHLCASMKGHVLPALLANSVPCTINSDNPAYFGSSLSHDFYQTILHHNSMTLFGWRVLAEWSIEHSCMDAEQRADAFRTWEANWAKFCQWIVEEFGPEYLSFPVSTGVRNPN